MKKNNDLNDEYSRVCNAYLLQFCKQMDMPLCDKDPWVASEAGTIACVGDYFFDFHDVIKYVVDEGLTDWKNLLWWYDYTLECSDFNLTSMNYRSWHSGAPRIQKESFERLRALKKDLDDAIQEEKQKLNNYGK